MKVIKIGGSLEKSNELKTCLDFAANITEPVILVPGGGCFADQVRDVQRKWCLSDRVAHEMAILSMHQMGLVFLALYPSWKVVRNVDDIQRKLIVGEYAPLVWFPELAELNSSGVRASWDVTSDSLAAWLASKISVAELILFKSVELPETATAYDLVKSGIVDDAFLEFVHESRYKITITNKNFVRCPITL